MKCDEFRNYVEVWLDHELEAGMASKMEKHQQECPACARHLKQLQQANDQLAQALKQPPPDDYSWTAAEVMVRRAFARRRPESAHQTVVPILRSWLRRVLPQTPTWRALAALWLVTGLVQLLAQITDTNAPTPKLVSAAPFSEWTVGQSLRLAKSLANADSDESPPTVPPLPSPQGALRTRRARCRLIRRRF